MGKTITEFFVFIHFHLYHTEADSFHGSLFKGGAYLSECSSGGGAYLVQESLTNCNYMEHKEHKQTINECKTPDECKTSADNKRMQDFR